MTGLATGMAIDAAVGNEIKQIKEAAIEQISSYLQQYKGLTKEEAAAIVGGMTILSQAAYDSWKIKNSFQALGNAKTPIFKQEGSKYHSGTKLLKTKPYDHTKAPSTKVDTKTDLKPHIPKAKVGDSDLISLTTKDGMQYYVKKIDGVYHTWNKGWLDRGRDLEHYLGHNLHPNFPGVDKIDWAKGIVTSIKSRDLGAKTYQNATKLEYVIRRDIDRLVKFERGAIGGERIEANIIKAKALEIGVPGLGNFSQQTVLNKMVSYGKSVGIDVKIIVCKE